MTHIVFLDRSTLPNSIKFASPQFLHTWQDFEKTREEQVSNRAKDADIIVSNKVPLSGATLRQLPKLKMIAVAATGTNNIDLQTCRELGIQVCNITHYADEGVPEHALTLMLALAKSLIPYNLDVNSGEWEAASQFCFITHPITNLAGKTLGIIGKGALGKQMGQIASAIGMQVCYAARRGEKKPTSDRVPFEQLLQESDFISLHCPLTESNQGLISDNELNQMRSSAYLINTARGGLVNESAVVHAIQEQQIAGFATDVASIEPLKPDNPLNRLKNKPNVLITPHIAWASQESLQNLANQLIRNIESFSHGQLLNRII